MRGKEGSIIMYGEVRREKKARKGLEEIIVQHETMDSQNSQEKNHTYQPI